MAIRTTVVGSYPKPPAQGGSFTLRKTLQALDRGEASWDDVTKAQDDLAREVIEEQQSAGIDLVTDGHVRWDDIVTPFARKLEGFEIGGLLRWFDNNVYYRRPICNGDVSWTEPCSVDAFTFASSVATAQVKAVIPGPVTFARLSIDEHYADHDSFTLALADALAQEARALQDAGAAVIQIDEPALLDAPEDLELAKKAIARITAGAEDRFILCTYFGDAKRLGPELFGLPVSGFGFDLVSGPENLELIAEAPAGTTIQAGVVDARNTRLEDTDEIVRTLSRIAESAGPDHVWASPSAGLEFLPREKAHAKLQRLAEAARKVGE